VPVARRGRAVGSRHDVWVDHRDKRVEVAASRGGEEGVDGLSLTDQIGVGNRGRSLYPAACAAGDRPANMSCSTNAGPSRRDLRNCGPATFPGPARSCWRLRRRPLLAPPQPPGSVIIAATVAQSLTVADLAVWSLRLDPRSCESEAAA